MCLFVFYFIISIVVELYREWNIVYCLFYFMMYEKVVLLINRNIVFFVFKYLIKNKKKLDKI